MNHLITELIKNELRQKCIKNCQLLSINNLVNVVNYFCRAFVLLLVKQMKNKYFCVLNVVFYRS